MLRRRFWIKVAIIISAISLLLGTLAVLLKQTPEFYSVAPSPEAEATLGSDVLTRFGDLRNDILSQPDWGSSFSAEELNAFLRDHMDDREGLAGLLLRGLKSPRVAIEGDRLKIAARYQPGESETFSTIVSVELKVWLVSREINMLAVELVGAWAGSLPVTSLPFGPQTQLDSITENARQSNIAVIWYRNNGNLVGLFRFYADQPQPGVQIRTTKISDGRLTIAGRTRLDQMIVPAGDPFRR